MKVFITGANGLLGQKLIELYNELQPDADVVAISKGPEMISSGDYRYIDVNISDRDKVITLMHEEKPDVLINCAAITNVDRCELQKNLCWAVNVEAVKNIADVCHYTNTFLIQLSTDFIFDGEDGPYDEKATPNPVNFYGSSKYEVEKYLNNLKIRHAIIRTNQVYGYVEGLKRPNIVTWVKDNLEKDMPIQALTDQYRTPALADDLAMGCYLVAIHSAPGVYNIGSKELISVYEFAKIVAEVCQLDTELIYPVESGAFKQIAKRPLKTGLIINKAMHNLGYKPHTIRQGIELMIEQML